MLFAFYLQVTTIGNFYLQVTTISKSFSISEISNILLPSYFGNCIVATALVLINISPTSTYVYLLWPKHDECCFRLLCVCVTAL